jgi:oligopeptide transport system ATP-binding protein
LYTHPQHPYTRALLSAIPIPDPRLERAKVIELLQGDMPSPVDPPSGCAFRTRCPLAKAGCSQAIPELRVTTGTTEAACILL